MPKRLAEPSSDAGVGGKKLIERKRDWIGHAETWVGKGKGKINGEKSEVRGQRSEVRSQKSEAVVDRREQRRMPQVAFSEVLLISDL
jgi:hypothetical protein